MSEDRRRPIIFDFLTPALLAGAKTCLRLMWDEEAALTYHKGDVVTVYDFTPRNGGRPVAVIRLTERPTLEPMSMLTMADYDAEGWAWMHKHPKAVSSRAFGKRQRREAFTRARFDDWSRQRYSRWVFRFTLVRVLADPRVLVGAGRS